MDGLWLESLGYRFLFVTLSDGLFFVCISSGLSSSLVFLCFFTSVPDCDLLSHFCMRRCCLCCPGLDLQCLCQMCSCSSGNGERCCSKRSVAPLVDISQSEICAFRGQTQAQYNIIATVAQAGAPPSLCQQISQGRCLFPPAYYQTSLRPGVALGDNI